MNRDDPELTDNPYEVNEPEMRANVPKRSDPAQVVANRELGMRDLRSQKQDRQQQKGINFKLVEMGLMMGITPSRLKSVRSSTILGR